MWQALLAAAVAGSTGFVAKHLFKPCNNGDLGDKRNSDSDRCEVEMNKDDNDAMFRFSSGDLRNSSIEQNTQTKKKKKGTRVLERSNGLESEKRNFGARRFGVSLKRRKICRNVAGKLCSSSQDTSLFSWGLGVGMMCMMSAGKAEFTKLNTAMTETAKVVEELKAELHNRKSPRNALILGRANAISWKDSESCQDFNESSVARIGSSEIKSFSPNQINDGECASVLTELEPVLGTQDMDQLEAELEFELQKLPWCAMEASDLEDSKDVGEEELLVHGFPEPMKQDSDTNQLPGSGILPEELDQKLCHLLIERQENQIEELESELNSAQRKLREKDAELQALKDCVKRLTEISISTFSDDETEAVTELEQTSDWTCKMVGSESRNTIGVGMKRPIDSKFM